MICKNSNQPHIEAVITGGNMTDEYRFTHNGVQFEIRTTGSGRDTTVSVWCEGKQVSPPYTAASDTISDFYHREGSSLVDALKGIAEGDISRGLYTKSTN